MIVHARVIAGRFPFYASRCVISGRERDMDVRMSPQEMEGFLSEKNLARIATVKPDNSPHVTPVWYLWENNQLLIPIVKGSVKEGNIRQNNRVAVTIDSDTSPHKAVIIEGAAVIEGELSGEMERRFYQRYLKPEDIERYEKYAHATFETLLVRIRPRRIVSWDYSRNAYHTQIRTPSG